MAMRIWLVTAVLCCLFASMWCVPYAAADTTWNIIETGCASGSSTACRAPYTSLPLTLGSITGSGTYISQGAQFLFSESGDFTLTNQEFYPELLTSGSSSYCPLSGEVTSCLLDVS